MAVEGREPTYLHGVQPSEQRRLEVLARLLGGAGFLPPLDRGMRLLDVGCGTGAIAREVALKVAPGEVIGVDREAVQLATAKQLAAAEGVQNVHFLQGDAAALDLPDDSFDAAYCRFVLEHVAEPAQVLREMARVVKPGGWVCAHEWEAGCLVNYPDAPAIQQVWRAIYALQERRGGDPWVARKLYGVFRKVGLTGVSVQGRTLTITADQEEALSAYVEGAREIVRQTRDGLLGEHLVTEDLLSRAEEEYARLRDSPMTFVFHGFCRAVGHKGR
jgi:ubiquinone/menaquinone biosynthesis C-methylase UbiE